MPDKSDRRINRTRNLLRDALIELILENSYDVVSVQDIAARADVGRATFYLHYRDKDELLLECVDAIVAAFIQQVQQQNVEEWISSDGAPMQKVFLFARQNADLFRVIMRGHGGIKASQRLQSIVADKTSQGGLASLRKSGVQLTVPVEVISNFFAGSLLALINWWLENDVTYSAEQMAQMFRKLVMFNRENLLRFAAL
jgi:AcrR family transcriptional regulator